MKGPLFGDVGTRSVGRKIARAVRQSKAHGFVPAVGGGAFLLAGGFVAGQAQGFWTFLLSVPLLAVGVLGVMYSAMTVNKLEGRH